MNIQGTVKLVTAPEQVSEKLTKQLLIVEYAENEKYPETISFEAINDKCRIIENLQPGESVNVHFNLKGREWNGKYFNTLSVWKVE